VKSSHSLDTIRIRFDDEHLVGNAGLLLTAALMRRLGLVELPRQKFDLGKVPGRAKHRAG
jgi:hypothetical protein